MSHPCKICTNVDYAFLQRVVASGLVQAVRGDKLQFMYLHIPSTLK